MKPKVSIVLVNYNGNEDTLECIKSLCHVEYDNFEVIVVDNASEMQKEMEEALPDGVIFIKSDQNRGFSGGNNLGIEFAVKNQADYVLLLNNDTVVEANFLTELIETASRNEDVGIITGKILYFSRPDYSWYAGGYMNLNKARIHHMHIQEKDDFPDSEKIVSFATGCLMMLPKNIIDEVGKLNELFFMYSEDAEYCARIQNAGYKIIYTPKAEIYHKVGASSGGGRRVN